MSIINEALKKAGQSPIATAPAPQILSSIPKKKKKINWGPVFVLMVLVLITGPLVAPIFSSPYRNISAAFPIPSYQETLASSQGSENRKAQFAIEEASLISPISSAMKHPMGTIALGDRPNFVVSGLVYGSPESYGIINGRVVKVGEKVDGAVLKSVTPEKAVLEYQGRMIDLWVNHG